PRRCRRRPPVPGRGPRAGAPPRGIRLRAAPAQRARQRARWLDPERQLRRHRPARHRRCHRHPPRARPRHPVIRLVPRRIRRQHAGCGGLSRRSGGRLSTRHPRRLSHVDLHRRHDSLLRGRPRLHGTGRELLPRRPRHAASGRAFTRHRLAGCRALHSPRLLRRPVPRRWTGDDCGDLAGGGCRMGLARGGFDAPAAIERRRLTGGLGSPDRSATIFPRAPTSCGWAINGECCMQAAELPISFVSWTLSLVPLVVLLVLLAVLRWKAPQAGPVGMFVAMAIAVLALRTPWHTLAVASAKGVWDAIFILYVVWPALLLYVVTDRAGGYEALRQEVTRFSRNELFIVVALGWVFSSFLQGIAGFGTPIAIV